MTASRHIDDLGGEKRKKKQTIATEKNGAGILGEKLTGLATDSFKHWKSPIARDRAIHILKR